MEVPEMMKGQEIPDPESEYLELQFYLKSDAIIENNVIKRYDLDDDTYAEEERKSLRCRR